MRLLLESVKSSRLKYEKELRANEIEAKGKTEEKEGRTRNAIEVIETEIKRIEKDIAIADNTIILVSKSLETHLTSKTLAPEKLQADNSLTQMGLQRKNKLSDELSSLIKRKKAR